MHIGGGGEGIGREREREGEREGGREGGRGEREREKLTLIINCLLSEIIYAPWLFSLV